MAFCQDFDIFIFPKLMTPFSRKKPLFISNIYQPKEKWMSHCMFMCCYPREAHFILNFP